MEEISFAEFGIKNIVSGLYVEMLWTYSDEKWNDYIQFVEELIKNKKT